MLIENTRSTIKNMARLVISGLVAMTISCAGAFGQTGDQDCGLLDNDLQAALSSIDASGTALSQEEISYFEFEWAILLAACGQMDEAADMIDSLLASLPARGSETATARWAVYLADWAQYQAASRDFDGARASLGQAISRLNGLAAPQPENLLRAMEVAVLVERTAESLGEPHALDRAQGYLDQIRDQIDQRSQRQMTRGEAPVELDYVMVPVFYGTNRRLTGSRDPNVFYGHGQGFIDFGVVRVSVPRNRSVGSIPRPPRSWDGDLHSGRSRYFILEGVERFDSDYEFAEALEDQVDSTERREVLVFIHGYNQTFRQAAERTAQIAVDLELDGAATMYSWPSRGSLLSYFADRDQLIDFFMEDLRDFLFLVRNDSGADRIHVVAHSMGNEFLLGALESLADIYPPTADYQIVDQVIWASPDVAAQSFASRLPAVQHLANRMTLYASSEDRALALSSLFQGGTQRAGDASAPLPIVLPGLDTVDTTRVDSDALGHIDFAGPALDDFRAVVWHELDPDDRCILAPIDRPAGAHYEVRLEGQQASEPCSLENFSVAITAARRFGIDTAPEPVEQDDDRLENLLPDARRLILSWFSALDSAVSD